MKTHEKFLEFNGKKIVFLSKDGVYWIALKPICEALNVDYVRQFKNIKQDVFFNELLSKQTTVGADKKLREMICLSEKDIYGWIASINSKSEELQVYKRTCYDLLYNHFHGTITNRKELLMQRRSLDSQIHELKQNLKEEDLKYKQLQELQNKRKTVSTQLNSIDKELIKQPDLFENS